MSPSEASRSVNSRLIAISQLACVVLFGVLLVHPWQATSAAVGAAFILACAAFGVSALSIARATDGLLRLVFAAFALLALVAGIGELAIIVVPGRTTLPGLQDA